MSFIGFGDFHHLKEVDVLWDVRVLPSDVSVQYYRRWTCSENQFAKLKTFYARLSEREVRYDHRSEFIALVEVIV